VWKHAACSLCVICNGQHHECYKAKAEMVTADRDGQSCRSRGITRQPVAAKPVEHGVHRGVDIILEMLANVNLSHDTRLLANNGRVVVIGSRGEVTINPRELMGRRASIRAFTLWGITPEEEADIHAGLLQASTTTLCGPLLAKSCRSQRRLARTRKSLKADRPAKSCLSADRQNLGSTARLSTH
jgi:hypothetical protein